MQNTTKRCRNLNTGPVRTGLALAIMALVTVGAVTAQNGGSGIGSRSETTLTVTSNILNSDVYIDGEYAGVTDLELSLPRDEYHVRVTAEGHSDYTQEVRLSGPTHVNAELQPLGREPEPRTVQVTIEFPDWMLNSRIDDPLSQFRIYIDDELQSAGQYVFDLAPGYQIIRIETGGLAFEKKLWFDAGSSYLVNPVVDLITR